MTQNLGVKLDVQLMQAVHAKNENNTKVQASTTFWNQSKEQTGRSTDLAINGDNPDYVYGEINTSSTSWLMQDFAVADKTNGLGFNSPMVMNDGPGIQGGDKFLDHIIDLAGDDQILSDDELQGWFGQMSYTGDFEDGKKAVLDVLGGLFKNPNQTVEIGGSTTPNPTPTPTPTPTPNPSPNPTPSPTSTTEQNYYERMISGMYSNSDEAAAALFAESDLDQNGFLNPSEMGVARFNGNYPSCADENIVANELQAMEYDDLGTGLFNLSIDTSNDGEISPQEFLSSQALKATYKYLY